MKLLPLLMLAVAPSATNTSTAGLPGLTPPALPPLDADSPGPAPESARSPNLAPGALLPKVGDGLHVELVSRFGLGTDAFDTLAGDPPYAGSVMFGGAAELEGLFAAVEWGFQVAGPEDRDPTRQTFQPWEIGIDAGFRYQPRPGWRLVPRVGIRIQPEPLGPTVDAEVAGMVDILAERRWRVTARTRLAASARVVGRYSPGQFDPASDRRLRRNTCFLWGRAFLNCALAFSVAPGTVGAEGAFRIEHGRWSGSMWGGWFIAGEDRTDTAGVNPIDLLPPEQGDWVWIGADVAIAAADDLRFAVALLTGGRLLDSFGQGRLPLFASDLARTAAIVRMEITL